MNDDELDDILNNALNDFEEMEINVEKKELKIEEKNTDVMNEELEKILKTNSSMGDNDLSKLNELFQNFGKEQKSDISEDDFKSTIEKTLEMLKQNPNLVLFHLKKGRK
jgi:hypothetical protein